MEEFIHMKKILFALSLFPILSHAAAPGFSSGNSFTATPLEGQIQVQCNQGTQTTFGYFVCTDETLDPAEFVHFVGPTNIAADEITLKAIHADKSTVEKSTGYDAAKGISTHYFNLWIATLFQTPLLDYGTNTVEYSFTKDNSVIQHGEIIATVKKGAKRVCANPGYYLSANANDCINGSNICGQYFADQNYCQ